MENQTKKTNEKLKRQRELRGWSQAALAREIGTVRQMVCRWEKGETPGKHFQAELCTLFQLTTEELGFLSSPANVTSLATHSDMFESLPLLSRDIIEVVRELGEVSDMDRMRRQLLQQMFGAATTSLFLSSRGQTSEDIKNFLSQCDANIQICWHLMSGSDTLAVQSILTMWLPTLERFIKQSSIYQQELAELATQGYILAGLVTVLQQNYGDAEACCMKAVNYSRLAANTNLRVAALKHLATKYLDAGFPLKTLQTYQEALLLVHEVSPLLRSRTYLGLALAYARCQSKQDAYRFLTMAEDTFPSIPESDAGFQFADCGRSSLNHYGGLIALEFSQPKKAWKIFDEVHTSPRMKNIPERTALEIMNCKTDAAIEAQNLELALAHFNDGLEGVKKLRSEKRLQESLALSRKMCAVWPKEPGVQEQKERIQQITLNGQR